MALIDDDKFRPWVEKYADDKDLFFDDFSRVFAKLIGSSSSTLPVLLLTLKTELGVHRGQHGPYESAPKKSDDPGAPANSDRMHESDKLRNANAQRRQHKL